MQELDPEGTARARKTRVAIVILIQGSLALCPPALLNLARPKARSPAWRARWGEATGNLPWPRSHQVSPCPSCPGRGLPWGVASCRRGHKLRNVFPVPRAPPDEGRGQPALDGGPHGAEPMQGFGIAELACSQQQTSQKETLLGPPGPKNLLLRPDLSIGLLKGQMLQRPPNRPPLPPSFPCTRRTIEAGASCRGRPGTLTLVGRCPLISGFTCFRPLTCSFHGAGVMPYPSFWEVGSPSEPSLGQPTDLGILLVGTHPAHTEAASLDICLAFLLLLGPAWHGDARISTWAPKCLGSCVTHGKPLPLPGSRQTVCVCQGQGQRGPPDLRDQLCIWRN